MARREIGPVPYEAFRQRVRRHRRTDVILAVAALNSYLERVNFGLAPAVRFPNFVNPFSLGGVARTALISGKDHRGQPVEHQDLVEMCSYYANLAEPELENESGPEWLRNAATRMAYEQSGYQLSAMENIGRTLPLLSDHSSGCPDAPTADDWTEVLGVTLEQFIQLGFAMHVAGLMNEGKIDRKTLKLDRVSIIFAPLDADYALEIMDRWFAGSLKELRSAGACAEVPGLEKWSLSPLVTKPVVALPDGRYTIPWPSLLLDRFTPTGLYFIGRKAFGTSFPNALGTMFQSYVGSQLALLQHAVVNPEIRYGKSSARTVDFFIVTQEVVVLVEVKAARPIWATRLGDPAGDEDTEKKVGYAFTQIERTAQLIKKRHKALAIIPTDRPLRGLVVTLEPFHLVNSRFYYDVQKSRSISTTVASSHELEGTVAALLSARDTGSRLLDALTPEHPGTPTRLGKATEGLENTPNPPLHEAWRRFSQPWSEQQHDG